VLVKIISKTITKEGSYCRINKMRAPDNNSRNLKLYLLLLC
jgi:hypothetical protein